MISSMTGFGRAEFHTDNLSVSVEVRSLNHRFADIEIRAPRTLFAFESKIREIISSKISRGRITLVVVLKGENVPAAEISVDKQLARRYLELHKELADDLEVTEQISLQQIISYPDVINTTTGNVIDDKIWQTVKATIESALDDLIQMRLTEGEEIRKDLCQRVGTIENLVKQVESQSNGRRQQVFDRINERINALDLGQPLDPGRLEMEVAILVEKMDVTEECIRFRSHNTLFQDLVARQSSEGRKLNFLIQEMHREANTIGAKCSDSGISHLVVEIKEEVEKLREQIQNIE